VKANQADYPVTKLCKVLGLSTSGFYAWCSREPSARAKSDAVLAAKVRAIHESSRCTYGVPRIHAELVAEGLRVGRKRVARLMRQEGLQGVSRRKGFKTTVRGRERHGIPDLVDRDFTALEPNELWVADITYVPTWSGFVFLAVVLDAFSRRIVGWSMASHLRTSLVLDALNMAITLRKPDGVVHHSDQGCQYTSIAFGLRCKEAGVRPSTGSVGDCYDNALCESFFATLECELIERSTFRTRAEAKMALFSFIEGFYNPKRRHSAIDYLSPIEFEARHASVPAAAK
jgi:putative transposase